MNPPHPSYLLFVGVGVIIALAFPVARHIQDKALRRQYYLLQGITLLGAVIGAKLSVLFGDYHWPWAPVNDLPGVLWSGRSITGALILGFGFAEAAKPLVGYTMPPNDRFAALLPFTVAIGRFGCLTTGCCRGLPYDGWCAMRGVDGVPRYPAQLAEIIFQITIGGIFVLMVRRGLLFGRLFSLYLVVYGAFRFVTEFFRETPRFYGGFSGYQILSLVMIALGAAFFLKRTIAPPASWSQFRTAKQEIKTAEPALGRSLTLPPMVGTSRCDVPARVPAGGTIGQACQPCIFVPSPDATLGDGDGAARPSLPPQGAWV
ncbi:MAG TPA: prolipoprotein diacylglyceryl transferase family protein [Verrucomicrobiae bacterium]|nr:prolipoprotein diacylglyceryl transferase family protein [Verrucomicrobiae bacterium]